AALTGTAVREEQAPAEAAERTVATDEAEAAATADEATTADTTELDLFNNDIRLRALKTLAESLGPVEQRKSIIYFSSGMERNGQNNQIELRAASNPAVRASGSIAPGGRRARRGAGRA